MHRMRITQKPRIKHNTYATFRKRPGNRKTKLVYKTLKNRYKTTHKIRKKRQYNYGGDPEQYGKFEEMFKKLNDQLITLLQEKEESKKVTILTSSKLFLLNVQFIGKIISQNSNIIEELNKKKKKKKNPFIYLELSQMMR